MRKWVAVLACAAAVVSSDTAALSAQAARTFTVRLSPVPVDGPPMMATIAGLGVATATLAGSRLTVSGSFQGLKSPATLLKLHRGIRGVRGPAIVDLASPTAAPAGTFSATVELSASQVDDLNRGRLYLQLYSEKAPEGNLWGWLLPQETRR
jgi:hypothetical protein